MARLKITGATIPYQLRPHKAIERNLFISLLRILDIPSILDLKKYRYVGFGAAFLEDFKLIHIEIGIENMDCIEIDFFAYSRQCFNNPYPFIDIFNLSSTEYIVGREFKYDRSQIIWLDFAKPKEFRQQLMDIELLAEKVSSLDILKFTFNCQLSSFISSNKIKCSELDCDKIIAFLKNDATYQLYLPEKIGSKDIMFNFSGVLRAMAVRAINRGLSKGNNGLIYNHITAFSYTDGQEMTTMTGVITKEEEFQLILNQSKLAEWEFYSPASKYSEYIAPNEIVVPAMTVSERIEIDKKMHSISDISKFAKSLDFLYGTDESEHLILINGYHRFYKYLPYYSKVIY
jgi:hypothetical protein